MWPWKKDYAADRKICISVSHIQAFFSHLRVIQGGSVARFRKRKNRGSLITDIKISFSWIAKISKWDTLFKCYTWNSVWRQQNREWLSQGSILQITHPRHRQQTTLTIQRTSVSKSRRIIVVKSRISVENSGSLWVMSNPQVMSHEE